MSTCVPEFDQARLAEVARLMAEARALIDGAATLLREGFCVSPVDDDSAKVASNYMNEWARLISWLDQAPVSAYQYTCQSEWTGGGLDAPGDQNVMRWPSSFGTSSVVL